MSRRRERGAALTVVLLGALVGALVGIALVVPVYRSEGAVRVHARSTGLEEQDLCPWRPSPAGVQAESLRSVRLLELALRSETWRQAGGQAEDLERFAARYEVPYDPDTGLVRVRFEHERPEVARAGVDALLAGYEAMLREHRADEEPLIAARGMAAEMRAQVALLQNQILALPHEYGGAQALEVRHLASVEALLEAEHQLSRIQERLAVGVTSEETKERLRAQTEGLQRRMVELRRQSQELAKVREQMARLQLERDGAQHRAEHFDELAARLQADGLPDGAITIEERGTLPTRPFCRNRVRAALLGALAGASLLLLLASLLRLRSS